jgi:NTE family protein
MLLDFGLGEEADLASYLLFDGGFARELIEMGRADAKARRDELLAFFGDPADDARQDDADLAREASPSILPPGT